MESRVCVRKKVSTSFSQREGVRSWPALLGLPRSRARSSHARQLHSFLPILLKYVDTGLALLDLRLEAAVGGLEDTLEPELLLRITTGTTIFGGSSSSSHVTMTGFLNVNELLLFLGQ